MLTSYVEPDDHNDADDHDDHDDDHDDDDDDAQPTGSAQPTGQIGHAAAKAAALTHAGVSESQAYDMDVELDDEDGRWDTRWNSRRMAWSTNMSSMPIPALY